MLKFLRDTAITLSSDKGVLNMSFSLSKTFQLDFAINALLSMNMVVTLLVAFLLDNTVPGSQEERGVYTWSKAEDITADPSLQSEYSLPNKVACCCCWFK